MFLVSPLYGRRVDILSRNKLGRFEEGSISDKRKKWVGERFGKLTVIDVQYSVPKGSRNRTICTCKCDCGNIVDVVSDNLRGGKKKSCGCETNKMSSESQRRNLVGMRFGRLVVEEMLWVQPHTKCRCKCDCVNETIVTNTQLTYGKTTSCGCVQRERTSKANTKDFAGKTTDTGILFVKRHKKVRRGVWEWECECPRCHKTFYGIPSVLSSSGQLSCGCAGTSTSCGEEFIKDLLDKYKVSYKRGYMTEECKNVNMLRFDFAILGDNGNPVHMIEYDGKQHYKPVEYFGGADTYNGVVFRDKIKNEYCAKREYL